ncbi:MAG: RNase adapter RapZ [Porticoccaceae bacterium]
MGSLDDKRLVVVSGRSGSGKSTALHVLEDLGFTCIDNLPANMLASLFEQLDQDSLEPTNSPELSSPELSSLEQNSSQASPSEELTTRIAVGIDARNLAGNLDRFPAILNQLRESGVRCDVIFLDASPRTLLRRFSETRRRHPLSSDSVDLKRAIALEGNILEPISSVADRRIDTSNMTLHQLRDLMSKQIAPNAAGMTAIMFQSFAFKRGVPADADFVFDVRCLPNPHWVPELRHFTGNDKPVIEFMESQTEVAAMFADLNGFLSRWIPAFLASNRSYLTIAIGCTGGQHRSVYLCNQLSQQFRHLGINLQVQHRELAER